MEWVCQQLLVLESKEIKKRLTLLAEAAEWWSNRTRWSALRWYAKGTDMGRFMLWPKKHNNPMDIRATPIFIRTPSRCSIVCARLTCVEEDWNPCITVMTEAQQP